MAGSTESDHPSLPDALLILTEVEDVASKLADFWTLLRKSEALMVGIFDGREPPESTPGNIDFGPALRLLNDRPAVERDALHLLGMPDSSITDDQWNDYLRELRGAGYLFGDGTLIAGDGSAAYERTFVAADPCWLEALVRYLLLRVGIEHRAPFATEGQKIVIEAGDDQQQLTIALTGDWGTGVWTDGHQALCPSQLVGNGIAALGPDLTIHLGDVYYAGSEHEEQHALVDEWVRGGLDVTPPGRPPAPGSFATNSNHEAYSGSRGYFDVALNPERTDLFSAQSGTSFFSIEYGEWLLLGLDSAYFDPSLMFMAGALYDPDLPRPPGAEAQLAFVREAAGSGQKVIVLTHHSPMNVTGDRTGLLWEQFTAADAFGRAPEYWYFGHVHNGIAYTASAAVGPCLARCIGHGAIPFGDAYFAHDNDRVEHYSHHPMPTSDPKLAKRVLNGFAQLTLTSATIVEDFHQVSNEESLNGVAWSSARC